MVFQGLIKIQAFLLLVLEKNVRAEILTHVNILHSISSLAVESV